jgi:excinuclease UvrABC nuclease subunit
MFDIKENLKRLPDRPGVYIHKDRKGQILYVGKAISLKNRVRQYFRSSKGMDPKMKALMSHIAEFEYIVTDTEMEALLLENCLIKKYMPKYNILLRDDKTFPYIKVTLEESWPRLIKTRRIESDGGMYFGPYTDVWALDLIIDLLSDIYGIKRCGMRSFPEGWKPCLNYHMDLCKGVCRGDADIGSYQEAVGQILAFLGGDTKGVKDYLENKMKEEAASMNYEKAALYRDQIAAIDSIPDQEKLDAFLSSVRRNRVKVVRRKAERKAEKERQLRRDIMRGFEGMGLSMPERIEAYDISHIAGSDAVGSMVVFEGGKPLQKSYRRFRIKSALGGGDTDSLKEVIYRRAKRGLDGDPGFLPFSDIILVDGGKDQEKAARQVLNALGIEIPVAGMVKDSRHRTRGLVINGQEIDISGDRPMFRFISKIQDEAHRFAIEYHRGLRSKKLKASVLDEIPGIGEKRKLALLIYYGDVEAIASAEIEELASVRGMNRQVAENVKKHLNNSVVKNEL